MSDEGDNIGMCRTDEQREVYHKGFHDAKSGAGDNSSSVSPLLHEFYQFGFLDGSS